MQEGIVIVHMLWSGSEPLDHFHAHCLLRQPHIDAADTVGCALSPYSAFHLDWPCLLPSNTLFLPATLSPLDTFCQRTSLGLTFSPCRLFLTQEAWPVSTPGLAMASRKFLVIETRTHSRTWSACNCSSPGSDVAELLRVD